jgi:hypothetical protein
MPFPIDSLLEFPKLSASLPSTNPGAGKIFGLIYRGDDSVQLWRDENGNEYSDQARIITVAASKTLKLKDRKTIQHYTGTGSAVISIPNSGTAKFTPGTQIAIFRDVTAGPLNLLFPSAAIVEGISNYESKFYPQELVTLTCLSDDIWHVEALSNLQIAIYTYNFRAKSTWQGASSNSFISVTPSNQAGTISVGLNTENSGGVFAALLPGSAATPSNVVVIDSQGLYANAVHIRRPIDGSATSGLPICFADAGGAKRLVFGLLQCASGTSDGATITATNLQIGFVYEDSAGLLQTCRVTGSIEYQLKFAVSNRSFPLELP